MALVRIDHTPKTVKVCLPLNIILPDPGAMNGVPGSQRKVRYLFHGLSDDATAWQRFSSIETLAKDYGLVVVMPSVGRSFYMNQPNGQAYFSYVTEELPQYLADVFNLWPKREDTLLAGLSMGGYGAFKAGLLHPEMYSAVASFSGVLSLAIMNADPNDERYPEFSRLFGDFEKLPGSEHDPMAWLQKAVESKVDLPKLFIACGRQDDLYPLSQLFAGACKQMGVPVDYHEEDGKHDWYFWDAQIKRFLKAVLGDIP
jgi:S-formylglutathione hydrolase FrmB